MNRFAGQKLRHRCRRQTYGHQGGKPRWGGDVGVLNWAIGIDMYTLMCIKLMTIKNLQYKQTDKKTKRNFHNTNCLLLSVSYVLGTLLITFHINCFISLSPFLNLQNYYMFHRSIVKVNELIYISMDIYSPPKKTDKAHCILPEI